MGKTADLMLMAAGGAGGGPPEYVDGIASSGVSSLNTSSLSGTQDGDVYIAALMDDVYIDYITTPSGWSGMTSGYPAEDTSGSIARIISYGTTSGTVTAVHPQDGDPHVIDVMSMVAFRNIGTPPSGFTTQETDDYNNEFILNPITVTEENSVILLFAMIDDDNATVTEVPDGFTLAVEDGRDGGSMAVMYQLNPSIGSTNDIVGSWSSPDSIYTAAYLIPPPA